MVVRTSPLSVPETDQARVHESWRRRQLLDGTWEDLLLEHITRQLGALRARLVGVPDTSENLFASVVDQTSTMYDVVPEQYGHPALLRGLADGGWWSMARTHQRYVRGLQESLVYVGWDDEMQHPTFELVTPDLVTIEAAPSNRSRPVTVWWGIRRPTRPGGTEMAWCWERWSVAGGVGSYTIWNNERTIDVTATHVDPERWRGDAYPYRDEANRPILPFAVYHAAGAGCGVWSPPRNSNVVMGSLQLGLLWTAAVHADLRASWDQRWLANGKIRGGATEQAAGLSVRTLQLDPTGVVQFDGDGAAAGAWGASVDIEKAERFARMYGNRLAVDYGLSPSDVVIESLNPASGASITVSQEGKRRIAKRDAPNFERGDRDLAAVVAAANRAHGIPCTTAGFRLRYHGIDLTADERLKVTQYLEAEERLGISDRVSAYMAVHPGTSAEDAAEDLAEAQFRELQAKALADLDGSGSDAASSPFATVGLPALVQAGIISTAAARRLLGVGEDAAPAMSELEALGLVPTPGAG